LSRPYDLVVVGMGSAGVVAAELAARCGARVAAVESTRVGGDCLWTGCVPSKALLASARLAQAMRTADRLGLEPVEPRVDLARVLARLRAVQAGIATSDDDPERFRALGVDVRVGTPARLASPHRVLVGDELLRTSFILLCPGSHPRLPWLPGLAEAGCLTSETVWDLERAPESLLLLGGGPVSLELAQAFTRLGTPTTILESAERLLVREEPELGARLTEKLRAEGVAVHTGVRAERVTVEDGHRVVHGMRGGRPERWQADELLVATGRRPAVEGLGLEAVGVVHDERGVAVDERLRTSAPSIYAAGDVTGREPWTHAAAAQAAAAVRDMLFPGRGRAPQAIPACTFTEPELASVGLTEREARERHGSRAVRVWRHELTHSDRARADATEDGAVLVVTARGRIVGAHVLAPGAGELISELALAVRERRRLTELSALVRVYPTYSTAVAQTAADASFGSAERLAWLARRWVRRSGGAET
jgi:pyruvate/2-oxoglutarate dehydrogenase complex dihydrolipoamide dehydrogenase (E3) component